MKNKIVVVKIGTNILTTPGGKLDLNNLRDLVNQICDEVLQGYCHIIVVTSGAITTGSERLGVKARSIPEKQAAAAVGQILLMQEYAYFFGQRGLQIGQVLLTPDVFEDADRCANVQNTWATLLEQDVIPVINENDAVATDEIRFGDNDELSARVSQLVDASHLVLLTDIDGVYTANPKQDPSATLIPTLNTVDSSVMKLASDIQNDRSRGGMRSKLNAARTASEYGADVSIANGRTPGILHDIFKGAAVGTFIKRQKES